MPQCGKAGRESLNFIKMFTNKTVDIFLFVSYNYKKEKNMQKQLDHYEFKQIQKQNSNEIIFVLDDLEHEENIGSAFRLADAFNIKKLLLFLQKILN